MKQRLSPSLARSAGPRRRQYRIPDDPKHGGVRGMNLLVHPSGSKSWVLRYTVHGIEREHRFGDYPTLKLAAARERARELRSRVDAGEDPAAERTEKRLAPAWPEFCERYLEQHARPKKKDYRHDESRIRRHILPAWRHRKVADIGLRDVDELIWSITEAGTPGEANRVRALISKMLNLAERWGVRPPNSNPTKLVQKNPSESQERFLTVAETAALLEAIDAEVAEREADESLPEGSRRRWLAADQSAAVAIKLIVLTGLRHREPLKMRWSDVDREKGRLHIAKGKSGRKWIPVAPEVLELLDTLPRPDIGDDWIFKSPRGGGPRSSVYGFWYRVRERAGIDDDVRVHDLRHSFASAAASSGVPLLVLQKLLTHRSYQSTTIYAHLYDEPIRAGAEKTVAALLRRAAKK